MSMHSEKDTLTVTPLPHALREIAEQVRVQPAREGWVEDSLAEVACDLLDLADRLEMLDERDAGYDRTADDVGYRNDQRRKADVS
jgi:hypothetical protein